MDYAVQQIGAGIFILIVLMVGIGLLLYQARVDIGQLLTLPLEGSTLELVSRLDQLSYVTIWLLAATLACGLFLIYPQIESMRWIAASCRSSRRIFPSGHRPSNMLR